MDSSNDLFRTMHIAAFGLHRLEASAPWGLVQEAVSETAASKVANIPSTDLAHFGMLSRGNCWLTLKEKAEPIPLTGVDCFLLAGRMPIVMRDSPQTSPGLSFRQLAEKAFGNVVHHGGGGAPTTIVCGAMKFERASLKPMRELLPDFIHIKGDQPHTAALHNTMHALASEMAAQTPGSEVIATRLAEVLFVQVLRAYIASRPEHNSGWLRAIFDPQIGIALGAIHGNVHTPWTVETIAAAAGMSRSGFAARFKELLGQTPLEYVTEWWMQKAMQLLDKRHKKMVEVARSVGYDSDAAFSKAFKRVVGFNPSDFVRRESSTGAS